jgi:hypothetical protein
MISNWDDIQVALFPIGIISDWDDIQLGLYPNPNLFISDCMKFIENREAKPKKFRKYRIFWKISKNWCQKYVELRIDSG